ncbi:MAG TPA: DUF4386 domain-containing protein [Puia sp.]|jgi:hypothetical protein|nr:DUF4386 domain-containing protein [Puia sp.]
MDDITYKSLKRFSRISGLLYLIIIGVGLFAEVFVREAMSASHNSLTIANKIQASEMFYRLGFVADLINFICGLPVILFFWILFRPSHKYIITLAIFFVIISNAVFATNLLNQLHPLLIYGNANYLQAFQPNQLAVLSTMALRVQSQGYAIGLVFFGFYCIIIGYLIFKTNFIPKLLGILYALAGLSYIINSFTMFLSHDFANPLFPYILLPAFIGEFSVCMWLLIMGIREHKT